MNIANGIFSVTCDFCRTHAHFPAYEANFVFVGGDVDRQIGSENHHSWKHTFNCSGCNKEIEFTYDVSECPDGSYNNEDLRVAGGRTTGNYYFNFHRHLEQNNRGKL